jgi:hypothetical protein
VFNTPVKIFIPYPRRDDVSHLHVYLYKDTRWVRACDNKGEVRPDGEGWIVPGSRVDHSNGNPSTVEIKVYHFSAVQAAISTSDDTPTPEDEDNGDSGEVDGEGCFIATAAYGSRAEGCVNILRQFRDAYLLPTKLGKAFVVIYYRYSPSLADFIGTHESLRAAVRIGLMPIVGMSYATLQTTPAQKVLILLIMLALVAEGFIIIQKDTPRSDDPFG